MTEFLIKNLYGEDGKYTDANKFLQFATNCSDSIFAAKYSSENMLEKKEILLITSDYWDLCLLVNSHREPIFFNNHCYETTVWIADDQVSLRIIDLDLSGFCPRLLKYIMINSSSRNNIRTTSIHLRDILFYYFAIHSHKNDHQSWSYEYEFTQSLKEDNRKRYDHAIIILRSLMTKHNIAPLNKSQSWQHYQTNLSSDISFRNKKYLQPFVIANNSYSRKHQLGPFLAEIFRSNLQLAKQFEDLVEAEHKKYVLQNNSSNDIQARTKNTFYVASRIDSLEFKLLAEVSMLDSIQSSSNDLEYSRTKSKHAHTNIINPIMYWKNYRKDFVAKAFYADNIQPLPDYLDGIKEPALQPYIYTQIAKQACRLLNDLESKGLTVDELSIEKSWVDASKIKLLILDSYISPSSSPQSKLSGRELTRPGNNKYNKKALLFEKSIYKMKNFNKANCESASRKKPANANIINKINSFFKARPELDPDLFIFTGDCTTHVLGLNRNTRLSAFHLEDLEVQGLRGQIKSDNTLLDLLGLGSLLELFLNPNCYFNEGGYKFLSPRLVLSMLNNKLSMNSEEKRTTLLITKSYTSYFATSL